MKLTVPAHKHVGDAGKPGQIVNHLGGGVTSLAAGQIRAVDAQTVRDLMYQHGISPFNPAQKQARTLKDTL